jgi:hypothetical protein
MNTLQPSSAEERKRKASIVKPLLRRVTLVTALFYAFSLDIYRQQQEESEYHAWPVVGAEHRETGCTTMEVGAKEVLTVTQCCPLRTEQSFHEVINSDPDVSGHTVNKSLANTFDYAQLE